MSTSTAESRRLRGFRRTARTPSRIELVVMSPNDIAPSHRRFAGDERRDRVEVLAVGLHGVWRRLARATVGEERREPLRAQN